MMVQAGNDRSNTVLSIRLKGMWFCVRSCQLSSKRNRHLALPPKKKNICLNDRAHLIMLQWIKGCFGLALWIWNFCVLRKMNSFSSLDRFGKMKICLYVCYSWNKVSLSSVAISHFSVCVAEIKFQCITCDDISFMQVSVCQNSSLWLCFISISVFVGERKFQLCECVCCKNQV